MRCVTKNVKLCFFFFFLPTFFLTGHDQWGLSRPFCNHPSTLSNSRLLLLGVFPHRRYCVHQSRCKRTCLSLFHVPPLTFFVFFLVGRHSTRCTYLISCVCVSLSFANLSNIFVEFVSRLFPWPFARKTWLFCFLWYILSFPFFSRAGN